MRARVLFFGSLKEIVGRSAEETEFPEGADLRAVFETYAQRYPAIRALSSSIVIARNQEFTQLSSKLLEGDEIAFLPPVSGGSGGAGGAGMELCENGNYFALTRCTIDSRALAARLMTGAEGAVVTFEGTARNHTNGRRTLCLDYEGYEAMALKTIARLGAEIAAEHAVTRIGIVHRLGRVLIGEASVVIVAAAAHRRPAFEAASEAIQRLKKTVPIWKKEHFADGEVWVEGEWGSDVPVVG